MPQGLTKRAGESLRAFHDVFRNPNLRRIQLAWIGSITGDWAYSVALAVYAYEHGGAAAVGVVGLIRWIPSAIAAPFAAVLGDRYRRERVMLTVDLTRAIAMGVAAAAVFAGAPAPAVFVLAALVQVVATAFRPAQAALLPSLASRPEELTAANVTSSTIESVGSFAGPALGGLLLALTSTEVVFAATAGAYVWSALNVARIRREAQVEERREQEHLAVEALAGFRAIGKEPNLRIVVGLYGAQTFVAGALNVLIVVTALQQLDLGRAGVGYLNAAVGVGGILGGIAAIALVGRRRLASAFAFGLVFWGLPIALVGVYPHVAVALLLLGLIGVGNTLVDVTGLTLLQRTVSDDVLARVFGVLESMLLGTIGIGAITAPALVSALGVRGALIAVGAFLPLLTLVAWRRLRRMDEQMVAPVRQLQLLRLSPIFAPLPSATLEHLASSMEETRFPAGAEIFRQGDEGDRFYLIADGEIEISVDGREPVTHGAGGSFGEIALLRNVPRTATVRAKSDVELYAIDRDDFTSAVTGHAASAAAANAVIGARLGSFRTGVASV
ncbi:MAG: MFS transporter [Actinomycetota bacterium]|nr:MFS transporter [Actinomycetota bacterium]